VIGLKEEEEEEEMGGQKVASSVEYSLVFCKSWFENFIYIYIYF
jgi:hypothetical protein